ncbi:hypothetical protein I312_101932 [Cryptococcus bacillisporus CA1280]|uniref:uncharacterized protein n=1 Tax=Cryptococcus bacillisporus CA1280 TaxID=1296109 RepID=UPI003366E968
MGLFGSSDPVKETEKALAREAKAEEKNIKQSVKSLNQVEKAEAKAAKAEQQAEKHHLKASKYEEKTAGVLNKATSRHEEAYHKENIAASEVTQKQHAHSTLTHTVEQKKAQLDALEKKHQVNEQSRQSKLHEIAGPAASSGNSTGVTSQQPGNAAGGALGHSQQGVPGINNAQQTNVNPNPGYGGITGSGNQRMSQEEKVTEAVHRM